MTMNKISLKRDQWRVTGDKTTIAEICETRSCHASRVTRHLFAFTLIELLVVISIIGILAGLTFPVMKAVKINQYRKAARAELGQIETALDNYKAKYGSYPPGNPNSAVVHQLYYELSGTTMTAIGGVNYFVTLDGSAQILVSAVNPAFGVGGFVNCTKPGGDEESAKAKNFLPGLKPNRIGTSLTNGVSVANLITSVKGPDANYVPIAGAPDVNPFRYTYPGTHNPNSYDLWVQLVISGKTNLICNWSKQVQLNSPLP